MTFLLLVLSTHAAFGWDAHPVSRLTVEPTATWAADLDADGFPDVITTSRGDDKVAWYPTVAGGSGPQQLVSAHARSPEDVVSADLDGDGDPDVVVASTIDGVVCFENLGPGRFGPLVPISGPTHPAERVATADLDGDGDPDVLATTASTGVVAWFENLGGLRFGPARILTATARGASAVTAGDLDGDGDQDVVATALEDDAVLVFENLGGAFGPEEVLTSAADAASDVKVADLDGDGDLDVVVAADSHHGLIWFENAGDLQAPRVIGHGAGSLWAGDVDMDGDVDILTEGWGYTPEPSAPGPWTVAAPRVTYWENAGGASFTERTIDHSGSDRPGRVYAADLNQDGEDVGAITTWPGLDLVNIVRYTLRFWPPLPLVPACRPTSLEPGDFDGDGTPDLVVGCADGIRLHGNARGTFLGARIVHEGATTRPLVGDVDGDGDLDLVSGEGIRVHANQGDGTFAPAVEGTLATVPTPIALADFDADGALDILTKEDDAVDGPQVWVYANAGGTVGARRRVLTDIDEPWDALAVDLDGDGTADPLVASWVEARVDWAPDGGLGAQITTPTTVVHASLAAGDLDGDGDPDLVVGGDPGVVQLENLGGAFGAPSPVGPSGPPHPTDVWTADIDGDGVLDVVTAGGPVRILRNTGNGFAAPEVVDGVDAAERVRALDVDGDGDLDLAVSSASDVVWLENPAIDADPDGDGYGPWDDCAPLDPDLHADCPSDTGIADTGVADTGGADTGTARDTGSPANDEPIQSDDDAGGRCGCSVGGPPSWWLASVAAGVALWARRRSTARRRPGHSPR
ncbi:MAG: VCBS repeat-containing protein [Alphaproteobacteria bacterium]|nr:VCBS repeat-containing protein [Alphaproteobacteria bacterium]